MFNRRMKESPLFIHNFYEHFSSSLMFTIAYQNSPSSSNVIPSSARLASPTCFHSEELKNHIVMQFIHFVLLYLS